jgi:acyl carrier protein
MQDELTKRIIAVIAATQHIDEGKITVDSTFQELGIDSLDGINILFALENEFDINIPDDAAREIRGVREMVEGVRKLVEMKQAEAGSTAGA